MNLMRMSNIGGDIVEATRSVRREDGAWRVMIDETELTIPNKTFFGDPPERSVALSQFPSPFPRNPFNEGADWNKVRRCWSEIA